MGSGADKRSLTLSVYDVLLGERQHRRRQAAQPARRIDVLGANRELAGAEVELVSLERREQRLKGSALAAVASDYDFVTHRPPAVAGARSRSTAACRAWRGRADAVRVLRARGAVGPVNTIKQVHANLNRDPQIIGLLRVVTTRITLQQQVSEQLKAHFGSKVFDTVIPRNVRLAEGAELACPASFDPGPRARRPSSPFAAEMVARTRPTV